MYQWLLLPQFLDAKAPQREIPVADLEEMPPWGRMGYLGTFLLSMCCWPLRALTPWKSILWPIIDPILVTFGQICNFCDPNLDTFYFYELTHFLNWMKNTSIFTYSTNILVRLPTVNEILCYPKKSQPHSSNSSENVTPLVNPVMKMRPHPAAHPH